MGSLTISRNANALNLTYGVVCKVSTILLARCHFPFSHGTIQSFPLSKFLTERFVLLLTALRTAQSYDGVLNNNRLIGLLIRKR